MIRLTKKEKSLAVLLGTFVVLWGIFATVISPALERIRTLNRVIPDKQAELNQLVAKSSQYITLRDSLGDLHSKIDSQPNNFRLLPFLESLIHQSDLSERVATMNQRVAKLQNDYYETVVEIKLQQLTLRQLVDLLAKAEASDAVAKTKTLFITRNPTNNDLLDSVVEIHSATLNPDPTSGT
jgi:type II secretory pathway component PulM